MGNTGEIIKILTQKVENCHWTGAGPIYELEIEKFKIFISQYEISIVFEERNGSPKEKKVPLNISESSLYEKVRNKVESEKNKMLDELIRHLKTL